MSDVRVRQITTYELSSKHLTGTLKSTFYDINDSGDLITEKVVDFHKDSLINILTNNSLSLERLKEIYEELGSLIEVANSIMVTDKLSE